MVAAASVAGNTRMGMFTRLILRYPFHVGRAAIWTPSTRENEMLARLSLGEGGCLQLSTVPGSKCTPTQDCSGPGDTTDHTATQRRGGLWARRITRGTGAPE